MDDPLAVGCGERGGDLGGDAELLCVRQLGRRGRKRPTLEILEHEVVRLRRLDQVIDATDVRVVEAGEQPGLAQESGLPLRSEIALAHDLDRHRSLQLLVEAAIDASHAALAEQRLDADAADARADHGAMAESLPEPRRASIGASWGAGAPE